MSQRWERILVVLGVCLPVPLFAATGLSIPLPAPVERIAAALVPWAEAATLDANQSFARGARGSIVLLPDEARVRQYNEPDKTSLGDADPRPEGDGSAPAAGGGKGTSTKEKGGGKSQDAAEADPGATSEEPKSKPDPGGEKPKPDPGGEEPSGEPGPVEDTVDEVEGTVNDVDETADGLADQVGDTVGGAGETVDGIISGLGG